MNFDELQKKVRAEMENITFNPKSLHDPMIRCTNFLIGAGILNDFIYECRCDLSRLQTVTEALYKDAINTAEGKNITEKKISAAAHIEYNSAREAADQIDGMIKWSKTALDIFNNAHITYRQLTRD